MVKPLHAGTAAAAGLLAADLAAAGFTADLDILDGPRNFLEVYAGAGAQADPAGLFAPGEPFELVETGIALKRFACCGAIHATADAVLTIREQHPEVAWIDAVRTIECRVNRMSPDILIHHRAESPDEGKFCLEYSVAAALLDGALGLAQYTPERIADPAVQTLSSRVKVVVDPDMAVHYTSFPGAVEIELSDGRRLSSSVHSQKGNPDNPLSAADVEAKFMECAEPVLGATGTRSALDLLNRLEDIADLRRVGMALRPLAAQAGAARGSPR
jgi:2-methylcitrate dehydratase PrpD